MQDAAAVVGWGTSIRDYSHLPLLSLAPALTRPWTFCIKAPASAASSNSTAAMSRLRPYLGSSSSAPVGSCHRAVTTSHSIPAASASLQLYDTEKVHFKSKKTQKTGANRGGTPVLVDGEAPARGVTYARRRLMLGAREGA